MDVAEDVNRKKYIGGKDLRDNMKHKSNEWTRLIEFLRFGFVGGSMTVLSFGLYLVLNERLGVFYILSNALSYGVAVLMSYFLNLWFTFKRKAGKIREFIQYISMRIVFLGVDSIVLFLCVQVLCIDKYIAKIVITIIMLGLTYIFSRKIFRKGNDEL